jgi:predicted HTH transcriptional regulator
VFEPKAELLERIWRGEDALLTMRTVQFRGAAVHTPEQEGLADEMAAFANTQGGVLLLGVDGTTRDIEGLPYSKLDDVERYVLEICDDLVAPPLNAIIIRLEVPDSTGTNRAILKVEIPHSLFVHQSPGGYFRRLGGSKREMAPDLLARLFQQRSQARLIRFEEQAVPSTTPQDLREDLWRRFTARSGEEAAVVLQKRGLLVQDDMGVLRASVAGVLMCSEHPERHLPGAFIEAVHYRGVHQDSNYQRRAQRICGSLDDQIRQAMWFLDQTQSVGAKKVPHRVEYPQFSERAVFEAIVNAVAHRDYSIHGSKIRFFLFNDRIEIYSPGALPNTVTVETLPLRQATRNELLTSLLAECPVGDVPADVGRTAFMEKRGDGVPIILRESERLSGKTPKYQLIDDSELLLTIYGAELVSETESTEASQ